MRPATCDLRPKPRDTGTFTITDGLTHRVWRNADDLGRLLQLGATFHLLGRAGLRRWARQIESFQMIVSGKVDHIAEQAFFNVGSMEDVEKRWSELQKSS